MDERIYLPTIAWRSYATDVILHSEETELNPAQYILSLYPVDVNELGAQDATKEVGFWVKDFIGHTYRVIEVNYGSNSKKIRIEDGLRCGQGPQSGQQCIIYKSVGDGDSPYLAPIYYRHLDKSALEYSRQFELDILWRQSIKVPFSNQVKPTISNYQSTYASIMGQNPSFNLVLDVDSTTKWVKLSEPILGYVNGQLDSVVFDLDGDPLSGYIKIIR